MVFKEKGVGVKTFKCAHSAHFNIKVIQFKKKNNYLFPRGFSPLSSAPAVEFPPPTKWPFPIRFPLVLFNYRKYPPTHTKYPPLPTTGVASRDELHEVGLVGSLFGYRTKGHIFLYWEKLTLRIRTELADMRWLAF